LETTVPKWQEHIYENYEEFDNEEPSRSVAACRTVASSACVTIDTLPSWNDTVPKQYIFTSDRIKSLAPQHPEWIVRSLSLQFFRATRRSHLPAAKRQSWKCSLTRSRGLPQMNMQNLWRTGSPLRGIRKPIGSIPG
jgi:hypothetical protein